MATNFASGPSSRTGTNARAGASPSSPPSDDIGNGTDAPSSAFATSPSGLALNGHGAQGRASASSPPSGFFVNGAQSQSSVFATSPASDPVLNGTDAQAPAINSTPLTGSGSDTQRRASAASSLTPTPEPSPSIARRTRKQLNATTSAATKEHSEQAAAAGPSSPFVKPSKQPRQASGGHGKSWTKAEDIALLDAVRQHPGHWPAIEQAFRKALPQSSRTRASLKGRYFQLQRDIRLARGQESSVREQEPSETPAWQHQPSQRDAPAHVVHQRASQQGAVQQTSPRAPHPNGGEDDLLEQDEEEAEDECHDKNAPVDDDVEMAHSSTLPMPPASSQEVDEASAPDLLARAQGSSSSSPSEYLLSSHQRIHSSGKAFWSQREDRVLHQCVQQHGTDWPRVHAAFERAAPEAARTRKALRTRYSFLLKEAQKKQKAAAAEQRNSERLAAAGGPATAKRPGTEEPVAADQPDMPEELNAAEGQAAAEVARAEEAATVEQADAAEEVAMAEEPEAAEDDVVAVEEPGHNANAAPMQHINQPDAASPSSPTHGAEVRSSSRAHTARQSLTGAGEEQYEDEDIQQWDAAHGYSTSREPRGAAASTSSQHQGPTQTQLEGLPQLPAQPLLHAAPQALPHAPPQAGQPDAGPATTTQAPPSAVNPHDPTPEVSSRVAHADSPTADEDNDPPIIVPTGLPWYPGLMHFHDPPRGTRFDIVDVNCVHIRQRPQGHIAREPRDLASSSPAPFAFYLRHNGSLETIKMPERTTTYTSYVSAYNQSGGTVAETIFVDEAGFTIIFSHTVM